MTIFKYLNIFIIVYKKLSTNLYKCNNMYIYILLFNIIINNHKLKIINVLRQFLLGYFLCLQFYKFKVKS